MMDCPKCGGLGWYRDGDYGDDEEGRDVVGCECVARLRLGTFDGPRSTFGPAQPDEDDVISPHIIDCWEQDFIQDEAGSRNVRNMFDSIRVERIDKANEN